MSGRLGPFWDGVEGRAPVPDYGSKVATGARCPPWAPLVAAPNAAPRSYLLLDSNSMTAA